MKFKLRGKPTLFEVCAYTIGIILAGLFTVHHMNGQEKQDPTSAPAKTEEAAPIKTWKLPGYMQENLQRELDDFNKRFDGKVQAYKKELKTRFAEFKDMPDSAILYLEGGFFITRSDFKKLQDQLRDKLKQEVKGDDKTTN